MGDQAVVVTGVLHRNGDDFETQYEIRRFQVGKSVFCAWCGSQPGNPPAGHYDLADGTLRTRFDPADYATSIDQFVSRDVEAVEGEGTETFQFHRKGFHVGARETFWDYQVGSLFHLVLPPGYLPLPDVESIKPPPHYGWLHGDRFVIGWQGDLISGFSFRFRQERTEAFKQQAEQLRRRINSLPARDAMGTPPFVEVDKVQQQTILFLAADPTNASRLRIGQEFREIQERLGLARLRDRFKLALPQLSLRAPDIVQALLDTEPQIVHFSGHGELGGALCFEDNAGRSLPVQPGAMSDLFEQFSQQVRCVLLNACYAEDQARAIGRHIRYVIGMDDAILDSAAIAFAVGFYQGIGGGRPIENAYKLGCVQIGLQGVAGHLTPVLIKDGQPYLQGEDQLRPVNV